MAVFDSKSDVDGSSYVGKLLSSATTTAEGVEYNYKDRTEKLLTNIDSKLNEIIKILNKK